MASRSRRRRRNGAKSGGTELPRFVGYCRVSKLDPSENGVSLANERERIFNEMEGVELTALIDSGGGCQAFWRLDKPVAIGAEHSAIWSASIPSAG